MGVRSVGLGQSIVRIVPDDRQAQTSHRGEGCRPGSYHHPGTSKQQSQEGPIASGRTVLGREHDDRLLSQLLAKPACQALSLLRRCHHDDCSPGARQRGLHRPSQAQLPRLDHDPLLAVVTTIAPGPRRTGRPTACRQRAPGRPWGFAVHQPGQEALPSVIVLPAALGRRRSPGDQVLRGLAPLGLLSGGVPGGKRQTNDVGACPGAASGDGLDEPARALRQDLEIRDHAAQW